MSDPLTWRNVSTPNLRDFLGYDGERDVARIYQTANVRDEWTWSVYAIVPGRPGKTSGHESDPKEARRKVEEAWSNAKSNGVPVGNHVKVENWG